MYTTTDLPVTAVEAKLTKGAVSDFLKWSTTRYNNYLNFGTKKENVDIVFNSLKAGEYTGYATSQRGNKTFMVECANSVGENGQGSNPRYWRTKQGGEQYKVDCEALTITAVYSKRVIKFIN